MLKTRSRPATGSSMWASAATCTTVSPWRARRSRASASRTASSRPARCCACPMRALWKRHSTRTWCCPALDAPICLGSAAALHARSLGNAQPGYRNEFHAGFQQAAGKNFVFSGDYIWKYTHNAFDFSVLGNTPITFPIDWHNSKIPGFALRADVPNYPQHQRVRGHVFGGGPLLPAAVGRGRAQPWAERESFPYRPR